MNKLLISLLVIAIVIEVINFTFANDNYFCDIDNHWAKDTINKMARDGAIAPSENNLFNPDSTISICEFLKILIINGEFELVTDGKQWPDWYINTAVKNKLIEEKQFENYMSNITRIDACKILARYIGLDGVLKSKNTFKDINQKDKDIVLKLVNLGIINGYNDGTFKGDNYVTRAQACKLIDASYNAKVVLSTKKKDKLNCTNSNIGKTVSGDLITQTRYEIKNNRLFVSDSGRYAKLSNATLNQEYVKDSMVIKLLNSIADNNSYIAVLYIPDKYTINSLNVCVGSKQSNVNNGIYSFQVRFYENSYYNLAESTGIDSFGNSIYLRIELDKMWDKISEFDNNYRASNKNLIQLDKALTSLFGESTSKELIKYLKEKLSEVKEMPNNEFEAKIIETKRIGKYTFDIFCSRDEKIQVYVRNIK